MNTTTYCTLADVRNRLSSAGVDLRLDDTSLPAVDGDVLNEAAAVIEQYSLLRYTAARLADSRIVKQWAGWIAAYFLCMRRNNSPSPALAEQYDKVMEQLAGVQAGKIKIADIIERKPGVPTMSNHRATTNPWPRIVVEPSKSTSVPTTDYPQTKDPLDFTNEAEKRTI